MVIDRFNGDDESYILYLLEVHRRISNSELCNVLNLSTSTIRKKLARMEEKGLLIRTHGGAVSTDAERDETMTKKLRINIPQKRAIASAASRYLDDGKILSFAGGSTILELAPYIMQLKSGVILTDSTMLATHITSNRDLEVHINNGIVRGRTGCVVGPGADLLFHSFSADRAFVGCDSFSLENGASSANILVGKVEQSILKNAKERYILCDSTKLNQDSLFSFMPIGELTALITDDEANPEYVELLRLNGLTVITAPIARPRGTSGIFNSY